MLVYANHLSFEGAEATDAVFKGIGGWLKEQLGFGLHPDQLRKDGEFNGTRGDVNSWLRILGTDKEEPALYSWVLKFSDDKVYGRQWITEVGVKIIQNKLDLSCVIKTEEHSTLVASPVTASQPRLIRYVISNVKSASANFATAAPGLDIKSIGKDRDSYRALLVEIERRDRDSPIVLVSPTKEGEYLIKVSDLQHKLVGLAQVVKVVSDFNRYEMSDVLGQQRSAWDGAINILGMPSATGQVHGRYFLNDAIVGWGNTQHQRISQILALITNSTNVPHLRKHIRPEGVMQLSLRRRMQATRAKSQEMNAAELRVELEEAAKQSAEQAKYFEELVQENSQLEASISSFKSGLEDAQDELKKKEHTIDMLKDQLERAGGEANTNALNKKIIALICQPPSPLGCIDLIKEAYGEECIVTPSARSSAEKMENFIYGYELMGLLKRLVTEYRSRLLEGGDSKAKTVFGKNEYAAKESESVLNNKAMKRQRTFEYEGKMVEMFRHLKIGVDDDTTKTIRVHFYWDADKKKIVIGYCGEHLPISSH